MLCDKLGCEHRCVRARVCVCVCACVYTYIYIYKGRLFAHSLCVCLCVCLHVVRPLVKGVVISSCGRHRRMNVISLHIADGTISSETGRLHVFEITHNGQLRHHRGHDFLRASASVCV